MNGGRVGWLYLFGVVIFVAFCCLLLVRALGFAHQAAQLRDSAYAIGYSVVETPLGISLERDAETKRLSNILAANRHYRGYLAYQLKEKGEVADTFRTLVFEAHEHHEELTALVPELEAEKATLEQKLEAKKQAEEEAKRRAEEEARRKAEAEAKAEATPTINGSCWSMAAKASGYNSLPGQTQGNPYETATGTETKHGTMAVDPNIIPYGYHILVPGYGWGTAEDTGGAILGYGNRLDLWFPLAPSPLDPRQYALDWGVRYLEITVCPP